MWFSLMRRFAVGDLRFQNISLARVKKMREDGRHRAPRKPQPGNTAVRVQARDSPEQGRLVNVDTSLGAIKRTNS